MRILFITPSFFPRIGGVEKHVYEVSRELIKKKHKIFLLTEEDLGYKFNKNLIYQTKIISDNEAIKLKYIDISSYITHKFDSDLSVVSFNAGNKGFLKKFRIWLYFLSNKNFFKQFDIIHCHDVFIWYFPLKFLFIKKPVYITFHGYETKFPPSKKAIIIRKISEKLTWGNICIGDYIRKWYGTKPDYVSYGGVDKFKPKQLFPTRRNKFKKQITNGSIFKILFIGRLEKDTGIPTYLKVMEILKERGIKYEFFACGDGTLRNEVEKFGKVNGFVNNVFDYINNCDIVFASSYLSILESLFAKKIVVSTYDNSLKRDYLLMSPFSKFIICFQNPKRIADKIEFYMFNNQNNKVINDAYQWARKQTWEKVANIYLSLWKNENNVYMYNFE